ncbi:MAG: hypothetical protein KIT82_21850 [Bradyrhizobium sp.]|nr:hypothetical protein [Bradyrhizobium sp.]
MLDPSDHDILAVFLVSVIAIVLAGETGRWLGRRSPAQGADSVSTLEGAILGLLALMIGFTFAMALSRFEARRDAVLIEANAIGTTALRARLLPAPHNRQTLQLLGDYVKLRLDITRHMPSAVELDTMVRRSSTIQEALWQQVKAVTARDNAMVPTGLFIQSLNEMIDNQEKRLLAARNRLPAVILYALYGVAIVAIGFAGYANGLQARRSRLPVYLVGILVAAMIILIQDLDRPGAGFIRVGQEPMFGVAATIAAFAD